MERCARWASTRRTKRRSAGATGTTSSPAVPIPTLSSWPTCGCGWIAGPRRSSTSERSRRRDGGGVMTTEDWFEGLTAELLAQSPFRGSEYFRRFAAGTLSREQVWGHISQHYLLIAWFPRIFSGIHARCEDLEVRKDCARHLLVEDLGYFQGTVGGTPDHDELYRRIGDDLGYSRDVYEGLQIVPEMKGIVDFFRRLAHEVPWSASLCATALLEEEVVEIARTVGKALVQHYGARPEWGAMNYTVHELVEQEEAGETKDSILKHLHTAEDRRAAEAAMREMHRRLEVYADSLTRRHLGG